MFLRQGLLKTRAVKDKDYVILIERLLPPNQNLRAVGPELKLDFGYKLSELLLRSFSKHAPD